MSKLYDKKKNKCQNSYNILNKIWHEKKYKHDMNTQIIEFTLDQEKRMIQHIRVQFTNGKYQ